MNVVTFAPSIRLSELDIDEEYPIYDRSSIKNIISDLEKFSYSHSDEDYKKVVSVIQSISTVRNNSNVRDVKLEDSRGAKLKEVEASISNLDRHQSKAVIETVDGVQRIRGLAGSGKTIILALKAAYLHAQHPEWKIAITFNTRALKDQFKNLITTFYIEQTNQFPNWNNLKILHAWGAPGGGEKDGIYYQFCKNQQIDVYRDFRSARAKFTYDFAFDGACLEAFTNRTNSVPTYDLILIDEAQDFSDSFFRICFEMLKDNKRLVYAYDELQSLSGHSLPSPESLFGVDRNGNPRVQFDPIRYPSQDIVLETCYRNPRPVLSTAHALGFGIYRDVDERTGTGLVQIFDNDELWEEVGYHVKNGRLEAGENVTLTRTEDSSPMFLEAHSPIDDLIQFKAFDNRESQDDWLVDEIVKNIENEELLHQDIIVINTDPLTTKDYVRNARAKLFERGINNHLAGVTTSPDDFFESDSIAFTGIHRAKGNEAAMVYIINGQDCYSSIGNLQTVRNRLFTAITRSKAWVRVLGFGHGMNKLIEEFEEVKDHGFELNFTYPTEPQKERIKVINKDKSEAEKKQMRKVTKNLQDVYMSILSGQVSIDSLTDDDKKAIRELAQAIESEIK